MNTSVPLLDEPNCVLDASVINSTGYLPFRHL